MTSTPKKRLDVLVHEKGLAQSRQKARALIMAGKVLVEGCPMDKPGAMVFEDTLIMLRSPGPAFVSRGGIKLEHAIKTLHLEINGWICLDVGASSGGFTDCLLQHGAQTVYALDVGYGQFDWRLRQDSRVVLIERTNIRYVKPDFFPVGFDLAVIDVSFISLRIVMPVVKQLLKKKGKAIALIKPQFEAGKGQVGKGGVVRDPALHAKIIHELSAFFTENGWICGPVFPSPILGPKGNREFFIDLQIP